MGPRLSKTTIDIVNEIAPEVIIQHAQNCNASVSQNMQYTNTGFSLFSSREQTASINLSCLANFQMNANIIADIANKIQQTAESEGIALLDALTTSKSEANLKLRNIIAPKITSEVVQRAAINVSQNMQTANMGVELGSNYVQSVDVVVQAIMHEIANTGVAVEIDNNTSQKSSSKSKNPLSFLSEIATLWVVFFLVIIVAIIAAIAYIL